MIVVTGAAGFIGSHLIGKLNQEGFLNVVAIDRFDNPVKNRNLNDKSTTATIDREAFFCWLDKNFSSVKFIFHLGARTDTTETDKELLWMLNTNYSKRVWEKCCEYQIPLLYASSAATYGDGSNGYSDDESRIHLLRPLNAYGESKHAFDLWALTQERKPPFWAGLKFFNVYGPEGEDHKGRMASVVYHAYKQIRETGKMRLFRSHRADYKDGEQKRDFIQVSDVVKVMYWFMHHQQGSGIYNVGTGKARTFLEIVREVFQSLNVPENIEFIDIPKDIRDRYQYFTEAEMGRLRRSFSNSRN